MVVCLFHTHYTLRGVLSYCSLTLVLLLFFFFFFNDTATTEIYTLSLHDALPIYPRRRRFPYDPSRAQGPARAHGDRKSTRLNSSHSQISYAVFCLKKKKTNNYNQMFDSGSDRLLPTSDCDNIDTAVRLYEEIECV